MEQNSSCDSSGMQPVDERVARALADIRYKIVVMSGKGGVGKSTVAAYLALGLADKGYKVGLLDVDLHGPSIPRMLGLSSHAVVQEDEQRILPVVYNNNLRAISIESLMPNRDASVIWRGPIKIGVVKQFIGDVMWGHLDFLVIDSPPGTGDVPLTVAQAVEGAYALVVTTPQEIALADVRKSLDFCRQLEMPIIGVVENMSGMICPHCGKEVELFGQGGGEAMAKGLGLDILARLPIDPRIIQAADQGRPLKLMLDETGSGPAYQQMVAGVLERTAERS